MAGQAVTTCRVCQERLVLDRDLSELVHLEASVLCDACYDAQRRDVMQKLPVRTRLFWRVAAASVERDGQG